MRQKQSPILKRLVPSLRKRIARLTPDDRFRIVERNGVRFLVNFTSWADRMIVAHGLVERAQLAYFLDEIRSRQCNVFLDIGANMGLYSMLVARKTNCSKIIAFEPDPRAFAQLQANLLLNNLLSVVESRAVAVSERSGIVPFELGPPTHNVLSKVRADATGETSVGAVALDDAISHTGQRIAIKMDIEGHELEALKGMQVLLRNNQCFMQVECFDRNFAKYRSAMESLGYALVHEIEADRYFAREWS